MKAVRCGQMEFIGGPLDGLREPITPLVAEGAELIALPINSNVIRIVSTGLGGTKRPATSVAIYEFAGIGPETGRRNYGYVGPAAVQAFNLTDWTG